MPHLTCVGHTRDQVAELLEFYREAGVDNVLALAGDPPADGSPADGDFTYATELVELIRETGDFSVGGGRPSPRCTPARRIAGPTVATWPPSWRRPTSA